jgi:hypothetical protein
VNEDLSKVLWVLQENRMGWSGVHDAQMLKRYLGAQGTPYRDLEVRPFDETPITVEWDGPVLFYGSTTLVDRLYKQKGTWNPGIYYEPALSSTQAVHRHYGTRMLNDPCSVLRLGRLLTGKATKFGDPDGVWEPEDALFIRPEMDLKEFVGGVRKFKELPELLKQGSQSRATEETLVMVAAPVNIQREWRTIIVDGKVIAASQYKYDGRLLQSTDEHFEPTAVKDFAEDCALLYKPAPVFVLDVAELWNGQLRVVETNCFNCAGWYQANFRAIAREVTAYVARTGGKWPSEESHAAAKPKEEVQP